MPFRTAKANKLCSKAKVHIICIYHFTNLAYEVGVKNMYIGYMGTEVGNLTKFGFNDLSEKLIKSPERVLLFKMDNKTF